MAQFLLFKNQYTLNVGNKSIFKNRLYEEVIDTSLNSWGLGQLVVGGLQVMDEPALSITTIFSIWEISIKPVSHRNPRKSDWVTLLSLGDQNGLVLELTLIKQHLTQWEGMGEDKGDISHHPFEGTEKINSSSLMHFCWLQKNLPGMTNKNIPNTYPPRITHMDWQTHQLWVWV